MLEEAEGCHGCICGIMPQRAATIVTHTHIHTPQTRILSPYCQGDVVIMIDADDLKSNSVGVGGKGEEGSRPFSDSGKRESQSTPKRKPESASKAPKRPKEGFVAPGVIDERRHRGERGRIR